MSKKGLDTLIEISLGETRAARIDEDGVLYELQVERAGQESLVGNFYLGKVTRVEKGMDAVFVDIGTDEPGLINRAKGLEEGKTLIVQVIRDARDGKGPALTRHPVLMDRYFAFTPGRKGVNWARAVGKGRDRAHLEAVLPQVLGEKTDGFSVRGPAVAVGEPILEESVDRLRQKWDVLRDMVREDRKPRLLEKAPKMIDRLLRDLEGETRIAMDDRSAYLEAEKTIKKLYPDLSQGLLYHDSEISIFEDTGVEEQIEEALEREVRLKNGGSLAFDKTEALIVIDVNMGSATAKGDDAIFQVNKAAAEEAARQIMLRNLSGLIVIDFISMKNKGRLKRLIEALRSKFLKDTRHTDVLGLTSAGLMEITRQREGVSLDDLMLKAKPVQSSTLNPVAQGCAVLRAATRLKGAGRPTAYASPEVIDALKGGVLSDAMEECTKRLGRPLHLYVGEDQMPPQVGME
ncbi:ribonuclease E/G [Curvivirga aplysinae]|uniref:ribonuclease E/G n=1 Tax=Curvivirga aplysinae TaxID=2529852 RepID=UPI0012BB5B1A|nr:ribonuclease E/G [Curvivirga aplysinae]MTI10504.1 hypothetical protein [Curvivirga aplysinae]